MALNSQRFVIPGLAVLVVAVGLGISAPRTQSQPQRQLPPGFKLPKPIRPGGALEVVKKTTREYADIAKSVVLAKCVEQKVQYGTGGNIFTYFAFETGDTIKGRSNQRFTLRLLGGTIGDVTIPLAFEPSFTSGEEYVLMLGPDNAEGYATINPAAVFSVKTEPESRRKVVVPGGDGFMLFDKANGNRIIGGREWSFLDDFVFSLRKAMSDASQP